MLRNAKARKDQEKKERERKKREHEIKNNSILIQYFPHISNQTFLS